MPLVWRHISRSSVLALVREFDTWAFGSIFHLKRWQLNTFHRSGNGGTNQTIKPVIIGPICSPFPLVNGAAIGKCFDSVLGNQMLRNQRMDLGITAKQRQTTGIAHHHSEPRMNKRFPIIGINQNMPHLPLPRNVRNSPVQADPVAPLRSIIHKRNT